MDWRMTHWRALLGVVLVGALLGGAVYARKVEPEDVEVVSISLALPRLDGRFDGYRIAQISDLHADDWMTPGRVSRLVDLINAEEPDLVLITGDFATYSPLSSKIRHVPDLVAPLKRLHAPDGSFAVLGNHDYKTNAQVVRRVLAASGVTELCNKVRTLRRGGVTLHLCGHSHGGQLGLPLLRFPFLPKLSRRYPVGLYRVSEMLLYTNRGLGAHPRFRFACRPEVTIFTLLAYRKP